MTETPSTDLVVPGTGEVVNLEDPNAAAVAYVRLDTLEREIKSARATVREALVRHSSTYGGNTMRIDAAEVKVTRSDEITWDLGVLSELQDAGLPRSRWMKLVTVTVERKVNAVVARQIAKANPEYAAIIERAQDRRPKTPSVSVALRASV
jgi:hypothetical protein